MWCVMVVLMIMMMPSVKRSINRLAHFCVRSLLFFFQFLFLRERSTCCSLFVEFPCPALPWDESSFCFNSIPFWIMMQSPLISCGNGLLIWWGVEAILSLSESPEDVSKAIKAVNLNKGETIGEWPVSQYQAIPKQQIALSGRKKILSRGPQYVVGAGFY